VQLGNRRQVRLVAPGNPAGVAATDLDEIGSVPTAAQAAQRATSDCNCLATDDLPVSVPPGESRPIAVRVYFKGKLGRFQRAFALYTDDYTQPVVVARFSGRVEPSDCP
jgi:hypothetical protein